MLTGFKNRTGASSGIGEACAQEFAKQGSHLILAARRFDRIDGLAKSFRTQYPSIKVLPIALDVRDRETVKKKKTLSQFLLI